MILSATKKETKCESDLPIPFFLVELFKQAGQCCLMVQKEDNSFQDFGIKIK